jgi:hypothetical protein
MSASGTAADRLSGLAGAALGEPFGVSDRELAPHHFGGERGGIVGRDQGAGVTHSEVAAHDPLLDTVRKVQ